MRAFCVGSLFCCMVLGAFSSLAIILLRKIVPVALLRTVTCDFQQCGILTSVDSDEPVQPVFKLRNSN